MTFFKTIRVIDWITRESTQLPHIGKGNWIKWLISKSYETIDFIELGSSTIKLYKTDNIENINLYAIYFPYLLELDMECLFIDIPTEAEARKLIAAVLEQVQPLI